MAAVASAEGAGTGFAGSTSALWLTWMVAGRWRCSAMCGSGFDAGPASVVPPGFEADPACVVPVGFEADPACVVPAGFDAGQACVVPVGFEAGPACVVPAGFDAGQADGVRPAVAWCCCSAAWLPAPAGVTGADEGRTEVVPEPAGTGSRSGSAGRDGPGTDGRGVVGLVGGTWVGSVGAGRVGVGAGSR
ncbi:hypothetical protein [Actinoplanes nipponensis]|uniref:hypothetical protein n=1 Tax=Actinoplanes nipponensis TaxID=135950 RepID=UPI0031E53020